jgi:hypothetical protein
MRRGLPVLTLFLLSTSGAAQSAPVRPAAVAPRFYGGTLYVSGDWLQANAMPLDRDAMHSVSADLSYRRGQWFVGAGYLRIARELSTVQGASVFGGPVFRWKQASFLPFVGGFAGESYASTDSTGYDFVAPGGGVGHQPRYDYSSSASFGGGVGLTVEIGIYGPAALRLTGAQWFFSGDPLAVKRDRAVLGAGLSLRAW